jgi:hypothetical protein
MGQRALRFVIRQLDDVLALIGFVCVVYGVSQWSGPAAWIMAGGLLIAVAVKVALSQKVSKHGPS